MPPEVHAASGVPVPGAREIVTRRGTAADADARAGHVGPIRAASGNIDIGNVLSPGGVARVSTRTEPADETVRDARDGQAAPRAGTGGDVTTVPAVEEVLVAEKRLRLEPELRVIRRVDVKVFEDSVPLRRQIATVEHLANDPTQGE